MKHYVGHKIYCLHLGALLLVLLPPPPIEFPKTWDDYVYNFTNAPGRVPTFLYGPRLKKLDEKRSRLLLVRLLAPGQPAAMREKAIETLGYGAFTKAIPEIVAIAANTNEEDMLRYDAVNLGLRFMKDERAVDAAISFLHDRSRNVRLGALIALGGNGTDKAIRVLKQCLESGEERFHVIGALAETRNPVAGKIVFDLCPIESLSDASIACQYCGAMWACKVPEAQGTILTLMKRTDFDRQTATYVNEMAIWYFADFPRAEVSPFLLPYFGGTNASPSVGYYPILWAYATSPKIDEDVRAKLQVVARKIYPEGRFEVVDSAEKKRGTKSPGEIPDIIKAILQYEWEKRGRDRGWIENGVFLILDGKDPDASILAKFKGLPYPVRPGSEHKGLAFLSYFETEYFRWVNADQIIVGMDSDSYLVVRKGTQWVTVFPERSPVVP